jgi:hypothetical protein
VCTFGCTPAFLFLPAEKEKLATGCPLPPQRPPALLECRFHLWRDGAGALIDASPVFCDAERGSEVYAELDSLELPTANAGPEELCLSIDLQDALTQPSPFDHD